MDRTEILAQKRKVGVRSSRPRDQVFGQRVGKSRNRTFVTRKYDRMVGSSTSLANGVREIASGGRPKVVDGLRRLLTGEHHGTVAA